MPFQDLPQLYRSAALGAQSNESLTFRRQRSTHDLTKIHAGVFAPTSDLASVGIDARYVLRIRAAAGKLARRYVVSHQSAAVLHGLPTLVGWPPAVHFIDPARPEGQSWRGVVKHGGPLADDEVEIIDGLAVTGFVRTCIDLALALPFDGAVAVLDAALHCGVPFAALDEALSRRENARGRVGARAALNFASGLSDSAGESLCRVHLMRLGAEPPELQKKFVVDKREIARVDFWWPEVGAVLEFDGLTKYLNPEFRNGRTPSQVVVHERAREREILKHPEVKSVTRAVWKDFDDPWTLRRALAEEGVPFGRPPRNGRPPTKK